ncbi:membrane protein insertase YidC [Kiritimatiella glycovorans]|nr:membrane protein insertase YidC [Kiritimatiella glycovorans]
MNLDRKDWIILGVLFLLLISWQMIDRTVLAPMFPEDTEPAREVAADRAAPREGDEPGGIPAEPAEPAAGSSAPELESAPQPVPEPDGRSAAPERTVEISGEKFGLVLTSRGGGIREAVLPEYRSTPEEGSGPVRLNFADHPALVYEGLSGLGEDGSLEIVDASGDAVKFAHRWDSGLVFERTVEIVGDYQLSVIDRFVNRGDEAIELPERALRTGGMSNPPHVSSMRGMVYLSVDAYSSANGVKRWDRKISKWFKKEGHPLELVRQPEDWAGPVDWVAAKNKFFVQILNPEADTTRGMRIEARRDPESADDTVDRLAVAARFDPVVLSAGEPLELEHRYYVGPKKLKILQDLGAHQDRVMELGWFRFIGRPLLKVLNGIHAVLPNYGVAIILLTMLVRIIFWPVTHKSTESMKRMQKIQPLMKEIREKHKDNPQKMQQELMALYKEHKVNPMGGCLPMLIQIPVFIALFWVLRSAIELRFASFLWVADLSEPENLFADALPIALNILPLVMAGTMFLQQKLTPTAGDPQQQKMMMFMPVMLLFILYPMPSGLVLYWTTSNLLMIVQLLWRRRKEAGEAA